MPLPCVELAVKPSSFLKISFVPTIALFLSHLCSRNITSNILVICPYYMYIILQLLNNYVGIIRNDAAMLIFSFSFNVEYIVFLFAKFS